MCNGLIFKGVVQLRKKLDRRMISVILLAVMIAFFSANTSLFFSVNNFVSILREASYVGIIASGMTFVIITGGIDISVGSTMALTAMVCSNLLRFTSVPLLFVLCLVMALGLGLGLLNGFLVAGLNIPDFIVTLATMNIFRGLTRVLNATDVAALQNPMIQNKVLEFLGGKIGPVYIVTIVFAAFALISWYVLKYTKLGLYTYAVGSNAQASRLTGISFNKIKVFAFAYTGFVCAAAGIMTAARMMTATTEVGIGMEFNVISAIVIGGCSLQGGKGDMTGTVIGTLLMSVINSGIVQMGISTYYQSIIKGMIILAAVLFDIGYAHYSDKRIKTAANREIEMD